MSALLSRINDLSAGKVSLRDFHAWFVEQDFRGSVLAERIDLLLSEYTGGHMGQPELLRGIAALTTTAVLDLDDAYPGNDRMDLLEDLQRQVPGLKVTLFAIPGRCRRAWVEGLPPWVELVPHGWMHETNRECENWKAQIMRHALDSLPHRHAWERGFKAPGWQISDGCYAELAARGYWVADQPYNNHRRPPELRSYLLGDPPPGVRQIHGHVGHLNGHNANELEYLVPEILACRDMEWKFVSEVVR